MEQDVETVGKGVDAFLDEIYQALKGFGDFFVRPESESWVFKFNPCQNMAAHFMRALFSRFPTYRGKL